VSVRCHGETIACSHSLALHQGIPATVHSGETGRCDDDCCYSPSKLHHVAHHARSRHNRASSAEAKARCALADQSEPGLPLARGRRDGQALPVRRRRSRLGGFDIPASHVHGVPRDPDQYFDRHATNGSEPAHRLESSPLTCLMFRAANRAVFRQWQWRHGRSMRCEPPVSLAGNQSALANHNFVCRSLGKSAASAQGDVDLLLVGSGGSSTVVVALEEP